MTQTVTVLTLEGGRARVGYDRPTACHNDCASCAGGCGAMAAGEQVTVWAENPIGAAPGDRVTLEAESRQVYGAVLLVYALPLVLFFLGYALAAALGGPASLCGILGFLLGVTASVLVSRSMTGRGKEITFRITGYAEGASRRK